MDAEHVKSQELVAFCALGLFGLFSFFNEGVMKNNAGYSKFAKSTSSYLVSSQVAMLMAYVPSLMLSSFLVWQEQIKGVNDVLVMKMIIAHFLKRILEVLFLHKYSGQAELSFGFSGGCAYVMYTYAIAHFLMLRENLSIQNDEFSTIGLVFFLVGEFGNFYHHYVLSTLRKPENSKSYLVPTGGLFDYVICAHYLFELIAWLGIALSANTPPGFGVFCTMTGYLLGRSQATESWYKEKLKETYPRGVKKIIPFVF